MVVEYYFYIGGRFYVCVDIYVDEYNLHCGLVYVYGILYLHWGRIYVCVEIYTDEYNLRFMV